jgi:large subunit ribosomal protein L32e
MTRFLRSDTVRHSRLGKNRRKLQKWRKPRGRHSKIRRKRFGYPKAPTVGYRSPGKERGTIAGLVPYLVHNTKELGALTKKNIAIVSRVGARKKLEILKMAREKGIRIANAAEAESEGGKK